MNQHTPALNPDYFAKLVASGHPAADVRRFYQAANRLDTLSHVTAVDAEARALAIQHRLDVDAASLAALAHDMAAVIPVAEMSTVAEQMGIHVTEADRAIPALLHGPIAAAALADKLGVSDDDVLNAVRYHTTLRAGAGKLEKIVFLADKIAYDPRSPHRGEYLPALHAAESIDDAVLVYFDYLLDHAWRFGLYPHPNALAAYRDLIGRRERTTTSLPRAARVVSVVDESAKVKTLTLDLQLKAEPGQFVMAWLPGRDEKPFSLVRAAPVTLTIARVGPFTEAVHRLGVGDRLWIRGPMGHPFRLPNRPQSLPLNAEPNDGVQAPLLLVGGGYGVAPLYFLAERALAAGWDLRVIIGARTAADVVFVDRFEALGIPAKVTTDDGSMGEKGVATAAAGHLLEQGPVHALYACGPEPMLDATEQLARDHCLPAQLSYERQMRCALGVCGSCARDGWLVCRDGPVRSLQP